jgi:Mg-chelatase subunit ChlD
MGSYSGSSDWDDLPSAADAKRFAPRAARTPAGASPAGAAPGRETARAGRRDRADEEAMLEVGARRPGPLQLILAFDTTGSMRPYIENVREKIEYLAKGLLRLMEIRIAILGIGDHSDGHYMLQVFPLSDVFEELKRSIDSVRDTGGGDPPEAFECLFRHLNEESPYDFSTPTVLVLITDSVPHGVGGAGDRGCPDRVDARAELARLQRKLKSFYLVNCGAQEEAVRIQKTLVRSENYFLQLDNFRRLTNLVMAVCMDEVGELDFFMDLLEKQRGKDRREEVLALLGRMTARPPSGRP